MGRHRNGTKIVLTALAFVTALAFASPSSAMRYRRYTHVHYHHAVMHRTYTLQTVQQSVQIYVPVEYRPLVSMLGVAF